MKEHDLPFATGTIARLYMLQGKLEQAEAIYRELIQETPGEARLQEGLAEVRRRLEARLAPLPGDDRVELRVEGAALLCSYLVTPDGQQRAARLLTAPGELVLRVMAFPLQPGLEPLDQALARSSGELSLPLPEGARVLAAAVGLRRADQFVAIAHCTSPA